MSCLRPFLMKDKLGRVFELSCGRCINCKKERSKAWAFRLMCESHEWFSSVFVTLTYDDEHVPYLGEPSLPYYASLYPRDLTLFLKRLRKSLGDNRLKYYACGEYGSKTYRPHYHLIIFGLGFLDEPLISKCWDKGFIKLDPVNVQTVNYVAGYVQKKLYGSDVYPDIVVPPFSRMSKGLGKSYFEKNFDKIWKQGITFQGFRIPVPRYFYKLASDGKIGNVSESQVRLKRLNNAEKARSDNDYDLSSRFGYSEWSDEKAQFRLVMKRANEAGAEAREKFFDSRSKI